MAVTFGFRDSPTGRLQIVIAPAEIIKPGDLMVLDREKGWVRKWRDGDTEQVFVAPEGAFVNANGYLELPK